MEEIWKTTTVNKDYEVSNLGNIRSNKGKIPKLLKPFRRGRHYIKEEDRGFYLAVRFLDNGEEKDYAVHRLVAEAFIPNPKNLPLVNHINGVRNDNRAENLEWCDNSYNIWHSYNILGNKSKTERAIIQYTRAGEFIREWESLVEAERESGVDASSISAVCQRQKYRNVAGGFIWRYKGDDDVAIQYDKFSPVVQISKYGERLETFNSVREAAKAVGVTDGGVTGVCMKRPRGYNYAGGYIWRYEDEYDDNEFGDFVNKTFIQMTMNNIFVAEYKGTHDLVDRGGFELVKVLMCCRGKRNSTNGFRWCIKEEGIKTRTSRRERPVVQLDKDCNFIAVYRSAVEAAKKNSLCATNINACCAQGLHRTAGGYKWMYKEEYEQNIT